MKPLVRAFCLLMLTALLLGLWFAPVKAVSLTDSRISQLEYGLRSLQTQVNQLQSQLPRASGGGRRRPSPTTAPPGLNDPTLDEQFDNLATLVIELSQRVSALEVNVSEMAP